jgi:hypothetical protein
MQKQKIFRLNCFYIPRKVVNGLCGHCSNGFRKRFLSFNKSDTKCLLLNMNGVLVPAFNSGFFYCAHYLLKNHIKWNRSLYFPAVRNNRYAFLLPRKSLEFYIKRLESPKFM